MNREIRDLIRLGLTNWEIHTRLGVKADQINAQRQLMTYHERFPDLCAIFQRAHMESV